jgi:hypothetical protein
MPTLKENLRDHPIQSILTALASVATIAGFIFLLRNESCKKNTEEKKEIFFAYGKILNSSNLSIPNAKYYYTLRSTNYSDNTDYDGNYRIQIDTNRSFVIKIFCKIGHDSISALVNLTASDTYPQNISFPKKSDENGNAIERQKLIEAPSNREIPVDKKDTVLKADNPVLPQPQKIQLPTYILKYNDGNQIPYSLTDTDNELADGLLSYATNLKTVYIHSEKNFKRIRFSFIDPDKNNQPILGWINIKYLKQ